MVTPGGAVAHVAQQPRRSRFPLSAPGPPSFPTTDDVGCLMSRETSWTSWTSDQHLDATARASSPGPGANNLAPPAGDCSDPAAPLPPRVDIQDSAKQVADELRTLVSRAPPRSFQGPRLWDVARQALLGVDICSQVDDYLRAIFRVPGPPRRQQHRNANQPGRESRRKKKKRDYATTQERFKKRQADCARSILDGPCAAKVTDGRGFLETWRGYMTGATPAPPADPVPVPSQRIDIFQPATAQEIKTALPPKNSAAGPDGFSARLLRSIPLVLLRVLLNVVLLQRRLPPSWRGARTTFIPKKNDAQEPSDFRPITVGPVLQRLFHRILAKRATAAAGLDYRQRAFQPVDGCAENILLLSTALNEARQKLRPLYLASIDLSKAFDRVSTEAILRGALRAGFDDSFISYLGELYSTSFTTLQYEGEEVRVEPTTGVRQGDPLSPILFNLVIDEFLAGVDTNVAFRSGDFSLDAMAFADDLVVLASTPRGLQERLDSLAAFLSPRGLSINVKKSFTLSLQPSGREKKVKLLCDKIFHIDGQLLPASDVALT